MSFASSLVPAIHLLISLPLLNICDGTSLKMEDLLFIERRSHSAFDLVNEFYNRTLLPSCDVTANVCDINCCNDKDCNDENVEAFSCTKQPEPFSVDPILGDSMYCYSNGTSSDPVLCYETENSPFLGLYYTEDRILKRKSVETNLEIIPQRYFLLSKPVKTLSNEYRYGVPLRFAESENVVSLPSEVVGKGYCHYYSPIRFLVDSDAVCTSEISPEKCTQSPRFQLESYFEENYNELKIPDVYTGGGPMQANFTVQCGHDVFEIDDFSVVSDVLEECGNLSKLRRTGFDEFRQVCEHVVTQVEFHFTWEETAVVGLDVLVGLSEISTVPTSSRVPSRRGLARVSQLFKIEFHQRGTKSGRLQQGSYDLHDEILLHHV